MQTTAPQPAPPADAVPAPPAGASARRTPPGRNTTHQQTARPTPALAGLQSAPGNEPSPWAVLSPANDDLAPAPPASPFSDQHTAHAVFADETATPVHASAVPDQTFMAAWETLLGVEPRHLATFLAVADQGSFRAAAARLGYVQSAVSQQIAQLERALDRRLIKRTKGSHQLELTPAGRRLLDRARRIVHQVQAACADTSHLSSNGIRLAVEPAGTTLVPQIRETLGIHTTITQAPAADHREMLMSGEIDVGLGWYPDPQPGLSHVVVHEDRWVLAARSDNTLSTDPPHPLSLHDATVIHDRSHTPRALIDAMRPARIIGCDRLAVALELVRAAQGYALLPGIAVPAHDPDITTHTLHSWLPRRPLALLSLAARRLPIQLTELASAAAAREHTHSAATHAAVT